MAFTFKGGAHVREYKNTAAVAIKEMPAPQIVTVPLSQHIGAPCIPTVAVGDHVDMGAVIGDVERGLGCPVHASVSGTVKEIKTVTTAQGATIPAIVIENDGAYTRSPDIKPFPKPLSEASADEIVALVRRAGISGMGGATFPTHAKLSSALGRVDTLIINCAECEPFITANHRVMLESPEKILGGADILRHALGLETAYVAIEDNKPDAIKLLSSLASDRVRVVSLKTKYPQGDERQLIYALTKREIPAGKLPADVGCVIFNAETTAAVWSAFYEGMPLCRRVVTVDGDCVAAPANVLVHIGTSHRELLQFCGGLTKKPERLIGGGPMMGFAQWDIDAPLTKGSSAVLALSSEFCKRGKPAEPSACIRCGKCVAHCPMHLSPNMLVALSMNRRYEDAAKYHVMSCVECGTCVYGCPGNMPIVQYIRVAKAAIRAEQARARAAAEKGEKQ